MKSMTLIEFTMAAKKIVDDAGLGPCTVACASDMRINADGSIEYQHKCTAHPKGGMLTSWQEPSSYSCNNPALALERFKIAVDRRLAPPSEPEAITEIEFGEANYETKPVLVVIGSVGLTPSEPTISVSADGSTIEYTNPATEYSIKSKAIQVEGSEAGNG